MARTFLLRGWGHIRRIFIWIFKAFRLTALVPGTIVIIAVILTSL